MGVSLGFGGEIRRCMRGGVERTPLAFGVSSVLVMVAPREEVPKPGVMVAVMRSIGGRGDALVACCWLPSGFSVHSFRRLKAPRAVLQALVTRVRFDSADCVEEERNRRPSS